jgi:hypothetical protein
LPEASCPIFVAFARTPNYLLGDEIDIFDPQLETLHQSQTFKNSASALDEAQDDNEE